MKAEFKDGHFNACYGGNTIYEKSTLQAMKKADLIELIECAQNNYEVLLYERNYFHDMVLSMDKKLKEAVKLPELNEDERKYYDEVKQLNNGDKRGMITDVIFGVWNVDSMDFKFGGVYRIVEAIVKGGYNLI